MPAFFDSRDLQHRAPFGAVAVGTAVHLRVRMPRDWGCSRVVLTVEPDGHPVQEWDMYWAGMDGDYHEWWEIHYTPSDSGVYWYGFRLRVAMGEGWLIRQPDGSAAYSPGKSVPRWQLTCYEEDYTTPDWLAGGIMYQIFPDRFAASGDPKKNVPLDRVLHQNWQEPVVWQPDANGRVWNNDFFGGDLEGIRQKLDYLKELGVTCIYINPIFEAHSNHRYDTADYGRIDPLLGDEDSFRALMSAAAERGMRVILDGVFSHTGADSVYFNRERRYDSVGAYNSPDSPYAAWYHFRSWPNEYASWWGFDTLPEVEELSPAFMEYINGEDGIVSRWLSAGAAGWRLDVADELPDGFLDAMRRRVKTTDAEALVLGEVWEDASTKESYGHRRRYLLGRQLDSVMNYPFRTAILQFLTEGDSETFLQRIEDIVENYPPQSLRLLMNHIGTHDTERVLTLLGGEPGGGRGRGWQANRKMSDSQRQLALHRLRLATLLQFALPGVPCIYYGDEVGMEGYKDPFNRGPFPWGQEDTELLSWYRRLGAARRTEPSLAEGSFVPLQGTGDVTGFVRQGKSSALVCAVNRSDMTRAIYLPEAYRRGRVVMGEATVEGEWLVLPPLNGVWMTVSCSCEK